MDFTNEINTLESEKLRLEEMLKRNNDRLQLLKEVSTKPSSDGYRRFFKLKGYSLLYTGGESLNSDYFVFNCTLISTAGHLSRRCWNVEELSKKLEGVDLLWDVWENFGIMIVFIYMKVIIHT